MGVRLPLPFPKTFRTIGIPTRLVIYGSQGPRDIVGFDNKADRKEFKRRWKERYPKEAEPETQVETESESEIELTYPLFAKSKKNGIVILFTSTDRGICVKSSWSVHPLGECRNNWVHATDKDWMHLTFAEAEAEIFGENHD